MNDVAKLLCILVSTSGGVYCVSLLRDCRNGAGAPRQPLRSLSTSARWKSICASINWLCQVLLATAFLAVAASLLVGFVYRAVSSLCEEPTVDRQMRRSVETVLIQESPPVLVDYDTSELGRPIIGIDCARRPVTDHQLCRLLQQAPELDYLNLAHTRITDEALSELSRVPKLRGLCLERTRVGDAALRRLAKLKNLDSLHLDGTNITDDGLQCLAELRSLRVLGLRDTAVGDAGLEWLGLLDSLETLDLRNTRVSEGGVNRLKSKLPGVIITFHRNGANLAW